MKYQKLILILILSLFLTISICNAEENNDIIDFFELEDKNISCTGFTQIITPFGDNVEMEIISKYYLQKNVQAEDWLVINQSGVLISEIEFYQDDEKKNFSEFFNLEIYNDRFIITSKQLWFNESSEIRLKFYYKPPYDFINTDNNRINIKFKTTFELHDDYLYEQFIFRIPTVNAHNLILNFEQSKIQNNQNVIWAPISKIHDTDEYLEISYIFWNNNLVNKITFEDEIFLTKIKPNEKYSFISKFYIQYETLREEWLIAIILSSIITIFAFIGGALWAKRKKE